MKKLYMPLMPLLLGAALVLSACGGGAARAGFESFAEDLSARDELHFTSQLRAEYDDRCVEFTLDYAADSGGCTVTVVSPEIIKGVSAHITAGETALEYDGVALDTGALDDFGLSPMSALPLMVDAMRTGYLDSAWEENGELAAVLIPSDGLSVEVHLDKYSKTPLYAEISSAGRVRVTAQISGWNA